MRESEVLVGDGVWDHREPVARLLARKDPLVVAKSLRKCLDDHKNNGKNMVSIVKRTCCTKSNMRIRQVREGRGEVITRGRHDHGFVGGSAVFIPFGGRCSLMTFLGGRNRSTQNVLHKEEKKVRESKVVVGEGVGDHRGPVPRLRARKDPLVVAKSLFKCLNDHNKTRCQGLRGEFLGGSERAYRQVSDGRGKVL